ncbi:MAG: hypothetical protein H6604_06340 [Flavobacteriales bacterium]|nr:hypothetical protein [Flavobacteriales bacterium]
MNKEKIEFKFFEEDENLELFRESAKNIWNENYNTIYKEETSDILFEKFYSLEKLQKEQKDEYILWIKITESHKTVGFMSLYFQEQSVFISKFLILKEYINDDILKIGIRLAEDLAVKNKKISIRLNVNTNQKELKSYYLENQFNFVKEINLPIAGQEIHETILEKELI